jgi:hypothetical protein
LLRASLASLRFWGALASRTLAARFCFFLNAGGTGSTSLFFFEVYGSLRLHARQVHPPCSVDDDDEMTLLLLEAYDGEFSQERGIALPTRAKHASHDG